MKHAAWAIAGWGAIALAIALFAAPAEWEGPTLVPISPGHALAVLDTLALAPLLVGLGTLLVGLARRHNQVAGLLCRTPGTAGLVVFVGGLGLGLLLSSAFSTFWWWWAIGATLLQVSLLVTTIVLARR